MEAEERVHLGFVYNDDEGDEAVGDAYDFPSKVGGAPVWLDPRRTPQMHDGEDTRGSAEGLASGSRFLLQIYAPVDCDDGRAFHRTMYLFLPPVPPTGTSCGSEQPGGETEESVRSHWLYGANKAVAMRCQLPRRNEFYGYFSDEQEARRSEVDEDGNIVLRDRTEGDGATTVSARWSHIRGESFSEMPLEVGDESDEGDRDEDGDGLDIDEEDEEDDGKGWEYASGEDGEGDDDEMTIDEARQVEEFVDGECGASGGGGGGENDRQYEKFLKAIKPAPAQCLRYAFYKGAEPLWPRADARVEPADIPRCEYCGGERQFEFQILPQLLHYLKLDGKASECNSDADPSASRTSSEEAAGHLDWGTVAVYSCGNSCSPPDSVRERTSYVKEFVWVQPPI